MGWNDDVGEMFDRSKVKMVWDEEKGEWFFVVDDEDEKQTEKTS